MDVHLKTLGCRLNEAETERWAADFQDLGHRVVDDHQNPDLVVLNTCAVTHSAARKSRQLIRRIQRNNPHAKLVVSGCYASLQSDELSAMGGIDLLLDNSRKDQLADIAIRDLHLESMPITATEPAETALFSRGRQRAFVKVQDGCRYRCTFCIVTLARGEESSKPIAEIVAEVNELHAHGVSEVILTGVHLGGYGSDLGSNLYELILAVLQQTDMPRIRMGSLEPWDIPDGFFELFENPRLMPHLHLPLQSGSDSVLRRMARRCKTEDFARMAERARRSIPGFHLTSDVIVGFPGETDPEWRQSLEFIQSIGFAHLHIFSYSKRAGTKAAALPGQVAEAVKKQRSQQLHALAAQMKRQHLQNMVGTCQEVLWEEHQAASNQHPAFLGYTPNYTRVELAGEADCDLTNRITRVRLTGVSQSAAVLIAEPDPPETD